MQENTETHFERLLESLDLEVSSTERARVPRGGRFATAPGASTLVYVAEGELRSPAPAACAVAEGPLGAVRIERSADRSLVTAGAALLTLGRSPLAFEAASDTLLIVLTLELTETGRRLQRLLPDPLTLFDFAALDPAVAALAGQMGLDEGEPRVRVGDATVCRLMARTVLLAVLRAWFAAGCAPSGWAARASDPQLDLVLREIHRDPGRDWTLESLATLGAMSRSAFAKRFREFVGESPGQYLTGVRMEGAKRLLATGATVTRTSRELGYGSDEGFSRAFRRHTGVHPSRWEASGAGTCPPVAGVPVSA